jgi:hypothetical protein
MRDKNFLIALSLSLAVCFGDLVVPCSGNGKCDSSGAAHHCVCNQYWGGSKCDTRKMTFSFLFFLFGSVLSLLFSSLRFISSLLFSSLLFPLLFSSLLFSCFLSSPLFPLLPSLTPFSSPLAICPFDCHSRGTCSGSSIPPVCACFAGWTGTSCDQSSSINTQTSPTSPGQTTSPMSTTLPSPTRTINYNNNKNKKKDMKKTIAIAVSCSIGSMIVIAIIAAILIGPQRFRSFVAQKPTESQYGLLNDKQANL